MDRTLTLQVSGPAMAMAWQPKSESRRQDKDVFRNVLCSSGVLCFRQHDRQPSLGFLGSTDVSRVHELQVWKFQFPFCSKSSICDGKYVRRRRNSSAFCSVLNEVEQSSPQMLSGPAFPNVVKDQLEALQDEALQVRNRYNNARARFMRLTEVAEQLRRRAAIDLNLGNEDSARKALIEKQKVIQAAELSKRRAQLLEELSTKLGEAISAKETQYIVALSTPQQEEPTVIVVSPKGEDSSSDDQDLDDARNPSALRTDSMGSNLVDSVAAATEDVNPDSGETTSLSGDVLLEREKQSLAAELDYSTDRHIHGNDEDVEAAVSLDDSYNMKPPLETEQSVGDHRDINVQSGGSLLANDSLLGQSLERGINGGVEESISDTVIANALSDSSVHSDADDLKLNDGGVAEPSIITSPENGDSLGSEEVGMASQDGREVSGKASFNDERRSLVERLILDVDHQVTAIELRLQTEVSRKVESNDTELQLVRDLLEQVQSLRARISEVVVSLQQHES
ncbi:unnamed protein product [Calypogeia fissa]